MTTARIVKTPTEATYFVELVFTRDLTPYGVNETEVDYHTAYFVGEPMDWQIQELIPESWSLLEHHVSELKKDELEDDELSEAYGGYLEDTYDPDAEPVGSDFGNWETEFEGVAV